MSHPRGLPDLFLDRSLGRVQVPTILRSAGLNLVTLFEHYGSPADQKISDVRWLTDATASGWLCLLKDDAVSKHKSAERAAIEAAAARCFCLARANIRAAQMAGWYLSALPEIEETVATTPGPFLFAVDRDRLRRKF